MSTPSGRRCGTRGARPLDDLFRDLGYALRDARRHQGFTLVAVLTLTLGIGANTAVFTVVDNFLFRPPPFEHVERLVSIRDVNPAQGWMVEDNVPASPGNFLDWREQGRSFDIEERQHGFIDPVVDPSPTHREQGSPLSSGTSRGAGSALPLLLAGMLAWSWT